MNAKRLALGVLAAAALPLATACSPTDIKAYVYGSRGDGYQVTAKAGPDDGGGSWFRAVAVCSGENFWRGGSWVRVEGTSNLWPDGTFHSEVLCPYPRIVIAGSWERM